MRAVSADWLTSIAAMQDSPRFLDGSHHSGIKPTLGKCLYRLGGIKAEDSHAQLSSRSVHLSHRYSRISFRACNTNSQAVAAVKSRS